MGSGDLLRWVASRGTIVPTAEGETMFMSGADCDDGDSDAFQQIFYSNSANGVEWSQPVPLITDDPTFSASALQDDLAAEGLDIPLGISAYYWAGLMTRNWSRAERKRHSHDGVLRLSHRQAGSDNWDGSEGHRHEQGIPVQAGR